MSSGHPAHAVRRIAAANAVTPRKADVKALPQAVAVLLWALLYFVTGDISHRINGPIAATGYIWLPAGVTVAAIGPLGQEELVGDTLSLTNNQ